MMVAASSRFLAPSDVAERLGLDAPRAKRKQRAVEAAGEFY